jgi:hypothetical protein
MNRAMTASCLISLLCLATGFMGGCGEATAENSEINVEAQETSRLEIDLLGAKSSFPVDSQGKLEADVKLSSLDGQIALSIGKDTVIMDEGGEIIHNVDVSIAFSPPSLPGDTCFVGPVYTLTPEQANFSTPAYITLRYDLEELPEGVNEENLFIASYPYVGCCKVYDEWNVSLHQSVDIENHVVTTQLSHLTHFVVMASVEAGSSDTPSTIPVPDSPATPTAPETPSIQADRVELVYFHRAQRCASCIYAEEGVRYTLQKYFEEELANSIVSFEVYDLGEEKNAAVIKKYGAYTSSLFINVIRGDRDNIEEVNEIWLVLGDDEAFTETVKSRIEETLMGVI